MGRKRSETIEVRSESVCGYPLDMVGFLFVVLQWHWQTQLYPPDDPDELHALLAMRYRKQQIRRLWSDETRKLFKWMRVARPLDDEDRASAWRKTNGKCHHCDVNLTTEKHLPNSFHVDHMVPVSRGGTSHIDNLVPACMTCNTSKGGRYTIPMVTGAERLQEVSP